MSIRGRQMALQCGAIDPPRVLRHAARLRPLPQRPTGIVPTFTCQALQKRRYIGALSRQNPVQQTPPKEDAAAALRRKIAAAGAPIYPVEASAITHLAEPAAFYEKLLEMIRGAEKSVTICALYLGDDAAGRLVDALAKRLAERPQLRATIVVDYFRGTRRKPPARKGSPDSSAALLQPLVARFGARVRVGLFHTPLAPWLWTRLLPPRYNELAGLLHAKIYAADDALILTGANLGRDYFENRQDRYVCVAGAGPAAFFHALGAVLAAAAVPLGGSAQSVRPWSDAWARALQGELQALLEKSRARSHNAHADAFFDPGSSAAWVCPMVQFAPVGVHLEENLVASILGAPVAVSVATAYPNIPPWLAKLLQSSPRARLVAAAPEANGFYSARGISRFVPAAYTSMMLRLARDAPLVKLFEYARSGWTFHAKGLWLSEWPPGPLLATAIGSSNYGWRSWTRDVECGALIVPPAGPRGDSLRADINRRLVEDVCAYAQPFSPDELEAAGRQPPAWVNAVAARTRSLW